MSSVGGYGHLLSAYPARLRRSYGPELIATMIEMAPGGRPGRRDQVRLVADGLRERFRPPVRRPFALVLAVLALVIGGALGAAVGSWAGTSGYPALPDAQRILPAGEIHADRTSRYVFAGETLPDGAAVRRAVEDSRRQLVAEGWQATPVHFGGLVTGYSYTATKDGVRFDIHSASDPAQGGVSIGVSGWPLRPAAYLPLTIAGVLLGMTAGWLIGVALTHRIRLARRPMTSAILAVTGLVLAIPSAAGFVVSLMSYLTAVEPTPISGAMMHEEGFSFGPTAETLLALRVSEWPLVSVQSLELLWIWGFAVVAVAAVLARRGVEREKLVPTAG
ncbi:hypothetical protein AB0C12_33795 [Actinoplanes sp. NPDC048967]|uniref:hypothetical protein n=1 Tax=Actinoplanes sp. NPDC048967 TaxID=3155269 RepID=UPI0033F81757